MSVKLQKLTTVYYTIFCRGLVGSIISVHIHGNVSELINDQLVFSKFLYFRILQGDSSISSNNGGPEFAQVFLIVWIGSIIVTLNSKLLGGNM